MAMSVPQAGFASMMRQGAKHYSGLEEAVFRNINACKELTQLTRTSLGPNGMNKMIINHIDKLFVTNDAATVIRELEVQHPAAKMLVFASQQQEQEVGDGTNFVITFAGELLRQAEELLQMGLHPSEIIAGYEKACEKALAELESLTCLELKDVRNQTDVANCLKTVLSSKMHGYEDIMAPLVAEACIAVLPKNQANFSVDNVRVCKILGGGVMDTRVIKGIVIKRAAEGNVTAVENAKIAVFACPLDIGRTETKGTVLLKTADELLNFSNEEEARLEEAIKSIADSGAKVVVTGSTLGDLALHFCDKYNMMVVRCMTKFELRRLCKATGATALARMGAPTPEEFGFCDSARTQEFGDTRVTVFVNNDPDVAQLATLIVRGSTDNILDDVERCVDDAVSTFKQCCKDGKFVAGAGATEIELARRVMHYGETTPGLDQYAIKNFARAFEIIPRTLGTNAGADPMELVSKLYAAHQNGQTTAGFDVTAETADAQVIDAAEHHLLDLARTKLTAIKLAAHAANTVLSVDQIIMAKPAGGPRAKANPDWDEER